MTHAIEPIAHVRGGRADSIDGYWGGGRTPIELDTAQNSVTTNSSFHRG